MIIYYINNRFMYFFFAPTLIYRDNYEKNSKIKYSVVLREFTSFLGCVFFLFIIYKTFLMHELENMLQDKN